MQFVSFVFIRCQRYIRAIVVIHRWRVIRFIRCFGCSCCPLLFECRYSVSRALQIGSGRGGAGKNTVPFGLGAAAPMIGSGRCQSWQRAGTMMAAAAANLFSLLVHTPSLLTRNILSPLIRGGIKAGIKKTNSFCFSLAYSYLWLSPKVLSLGKSKENTFFFCFSLAYSYFWLSPKVLSLGKAKEKRAFLLLFTRLFVPLHL